jgi:acetyl esterase
VALDEASMALMAQLAQAGGTPMYELPVDEARALAGGLMSLLAHGPDMSREFDATIPVPGGTIPARVLVPATEPRGVIVYYHGGGWVMGTLDGFEPVGRQLAGGSSCTVVLVDYRLAPEHRFPVAVEDAWSALEWVAGNRTALGCPADAPIVLAGDSAGGNLATVVATRVRDRAFEPRPFAQVLVYPATDSDFETASYVDPANQLLLNKELMVWYWGHYAPEAADRTSPEAAPLRTEDLTGSVPAIVLTAEHDPLRDEGEAYAERLRQAGVPVESQRFLGQLHGFFTMPGLLPGNQAAVDYIVEHLDRLLSAAAA